MDFEIGTTEVIPRRNLKDGLLLLRMPFVLVMKTVTYDISKYQILDLLGDVGGLLDICVLICSVLLVPYNYSLFVYSSVNSLFQIDRKEYSFCLFYF